MKECKRMNNKQTRTMPELNGGAEARSECARAAEDVGRCWLFSSK